jgi:tellurium resistance protein TerZ
LADFYKLFGENIMSINLVKGQKINLTKSSGGKLVSFCVGANWGAIEKKSFWGGKKIEAVDLDLSVATFDVNKNLDKVIYFGNLREVGITHSGDDLTGDTDGDDGLDNEIIEVNLSHIPSHVEQIVFVLNSYEGHDFAIVPFASIRLYEGTPTRVKSVVAKYNIASDKKFAGFVSMVLGKLYKKNGDWKFSAIGEPTRDAKLQDTLYTVQQKYL